MVSAGVQRHKRFRRSALSPSMGLQGGAGTTKTRHLWTAEVVIGLLKGRLNLSEAYERTN